MAISTGEFTPSPPYAPPPPEADDRIKLRPITDDLGPAPYIADRAQRNLDVQFEGTIDRLSKQAHEAQSDNPTLSYNSATMALHGIARARNSWPHHIWQRLRHG